MIGASFSGSVLSSVADGGAMISNPNFSSDHRNMIKVFQPIELWIPDWCCKYIGIWHSGTSCIVSLCFNTTGSYTEDQFRTRVLPGAYFENTPPDNVFASGNSCWWVFLLILSCINAKNTNIRFCVPNLVWSGCFYIIEEWSGINNREYRAEV